MIELNKNKVAFVTSGIRIGTAAVTTRGLIEDDMMQIVNLIDDALTHFEDEAKLEAIESIVNVMKVGRPLFQN